MPPPRSPDSSDSSNSSNSKEPRHSRHRPRKRFGQHFLINLHVIDQIIAAIAPQANDKIVEIGPGPGALTRPLLEAAGELDVIELDRDLASRLRSLDTGDNILRVHEADVLDFSFSSLLENGGPQQLRLIGNLPYNISTPLIFHILEEVPLISDMVFMLQKEVADRILAVAGGRQYGRLSVMLQYLCEPELLFDVTPDSFDPPPKVMSSVIRLVPRKNPLPLVNIEFFASLVKQAFSQRRKTLRNVLREIANETDLEAVKISPSARAETLELQQFVNLANYLAGGDN